MNTIELIKNNNVYKQILADSYGGVIYNTSNRNKYDTKELLKLWDQLGNNKEMAGGIMAGAINFIQGAK